MVMSDGATFAGDSRAAGWLQVEERQGRTVVAAGGRWDIASAGRLKQELGRLAADPGRPLQLDAGAIEAIDTAGAWVLYSAIKRWRGSDGGLDLAALAPVVADMLAQVEANDRPPLPAPPRVNAIVHMLSKLGANTAEVARETIDLLGFFGLIFATIGTVLVQPRRLRLKPLIYHMEYAGLNALPIVGLISFLIGVVLAYQGATQLQRFGAEVFVVDLIAVSILREVGILLTAIVVAGRSGSAFKAQICSLLLHQAIDAMQTMGLDPMELLVLPRLLALVISLPLLAFLSDLMGLLGGGLMAWVVLDITPSMFLERLSASVSLWTFAIGIIKAPVFAFLIAMIGCYEGFQVSGSAESVGRRTTRSVVEGIFLVMVVDAVFSIFFAYIGV